VLITAVRESVVLYAEIVLAGLPPQRLFEWHVDHDLVHQGGRFIDAFNDLFSEHLPLPEASNAEQYWNAFEANHIVGRCVRLGNDDTSFPVRHYHWAIRRGSDGQPAVHEFWDSEIWTTARYGDAIPVSGEPDIWSINDH